MNILIIVEGRRTEKRLYKKWVKYIRPALDHVDHVSDLTGNKFHIISGGGHPGYYDVIKNSIRDYNEHDFIDYMFICIDSEELSYSEKLKELRKFIQEECPPVKTGPVLIIQHHCIETWLMGNKKINISSAQNPELCNYRDFYDVNVSDPENLASIDDRTLAQFTADYLKLMLKEKGLPYSKNNVSAVDNKSYFNRLEKRFNDDRHIQSFGHLLLELRKLV